MSSWLKKQQPIKLYQTSDLPYIISDNGVNLCYDNCYHEQSDKSEFQISFLANASSLKRINTYYYKFSSFPVTIPFDRILSLDDTIIEGRVIKTASETQGDPKNVGIIMSDYIRHADDAKLIELNNVLEQNDKNFILVGECMDPQVRLFEELADIIPHVDWNRTIVAVAHAMCEQNSRKYKWISSIPELSISCYGVANQDELEMINNAIYTIELPYTSVSWED